MTQVRRQSAPAALLLVCFAGLADAGEKPLWELGAGVTALYFPDYPGSDQSGAYVLPFPYFVYTSLMSDFG